MFHTYINTLITNRKLQGKQREKSTNNQTITLTYSSLQIRHYTAAQASISL